MRPRRPPTRRATALALASAPLLLYSWPDAMGSSFLKTDAHASSLPTILPAQPLLQLYTSEPPSEGRWESWTFPVDVGSAVQQLRLLFFRWPGSKVLSQSPDRRYMRVTFEQAELTGVFVDDCQFYVVPTGSDAGGAVVVQCRRGRSSYPYGPEWLRGTELARLINNRLTRERLKELREALGWSMRASGSGDPSASFQRLQSMYKNSPLGEVQDVTLTDEQLGELLKKSTFQNLSSKFPED